MKREWTPDLSVGMNDVDSQHLVMFRHANQLLEAMQDGAASQETHRILHFLAAYTTSHFGLEEKYMDQFDYPGLDSHATQHRLFTHRFEQFIHRLETEGPKTCLILEVHGWVTDWLVNHIRGTDKLMGQFLKSQIASAV